jgi:hypothetical protein
MSTKKYGKSRLGLVLIWIVCNVALFFLLKKLPHVVTLYIFYACSNLMFYALFGTFSYCFVLDEDKLIAKNLLWSWYHKEFIFEDIDKLEIGVGQGSMADSLEITFLSGKEKIYPSLIGQKEILALIEDFSIRKASLLPPC